MLKLADFVQCAGVIVVVSDVIAMKKVEILEEFRLFG